MMFLLPFTPVICRCQYIHEHEQEHAEQRVDQYREKRVELKDIMPPYHFVVEDAAERIQ